jgi:hypothetical protein
LDTRADTSSLLVLRKLTRSISTALRAQLVEHVTTLTPILRPEIAFGKHIQGGQKDWVVKSDQALKDLRALYERIALSGPFNLRLDPTPPFDLGGLSLELTPVEYEHLAKAGSATRLITVRRPLAWTLSYDGFNPPALRQLLESPMRPPSELQRFVLAYLALHIVTKMQPGVVNLLDSLRFPLTTSTDPEFGQLPLTRLGVAIATERPPDAVLIESAEVTGVDAFEEVVRLEDVKSLQDPMRQRLLEMAREHVPDIQFD